MCYVHSQEHFGFLVYDIIPARVHNGMKKYWMFAQITVAEYMAYRMNFVMWRVRMVIQVLILYFLWTAVFGSEKILFGYTASMMLSYVLFTSILRTYILATTTNDIGSSINDGRLTNFLLRPISFFRVTMARDVADKGLNFISSLIEIPLLILILRPTLFIQHDPMLVGLAILASLIAIGIYFYFSLIIGFLGFWTPETWGPRFLSIIFIEFFSGALFPLDVFPELFQRIVSYLPFQYLIFFPISIYLGKVDAPALAKGLLISFVWAVVMYGIAKTVWHRGLKVYEAQGR